MKKSRYFSELFKNYLAEIDDLVMDSEGKLVLQKRLSDKRREFAAILPMIEFSPEMVAVAFYGAFRFSSPEVMRSTVQCQPDDAEFLTWDDLRRELTVTDWALPLIESSLKTPDGDAFLVATAAVEFLRTNDTSDSSDSYDSASEDEDEGDDGDSNDLGEAGAEWLSEQGFEQLDR